MAGVSNRVQNQGVYISSGFANMNDASLLLAGQLGQVVEKGNIAYQLVQFDAGVIAPAAGVPVLWKDKVNFIVTDDFDATGTSRNLPAGVAKNTMTASNYGWIQVAGQSDNAIASGAATASAGDSLIYAAADSAVTNIAAGTAPTYIPLAIATAASSGSATAGYIIAPHNGW